MPIADYNYSKTAWMTRIPGMVPQTLYPSGKRFSEILPIKVLLIANAPSHPPEQQMRRKDGSIFLMYMPLNVVTPTTGSECNKTHQTMLPKISTVVCFIKY